jgi:hypothetical protein
VISVEGERIDIRLWTMTGPAHFPSGKGVTFPRYAVADLVKALRAAARGGSDMTGPPKRRTPPPSGKTGSGAKTAFNSYEAFSSYHRRADATSDREIADKYAAMEARARKRDRRARRGCGFPAGRVRDLTAFFDHTYGGPLPDDDAGREDMFILAHHVARLNGDPERNVRRYAATWAPWMAEDELDAFVRRVLAKPYQWGADTLGAQIGLLDSVRTRLGITTIAPTDLSKAEREHRRREKWNAKRRKATREEYLPRR